MPLFRTAISLILILLISACTTPTVPKNAETTVIAVRHADRDGEYLNSKGKARANALPEAVAEYQIDAIYAPDIARNIETAKPLSEALGLPITLIPKENAGAQMTRDYPDGTVIWIGNKDNLRSLWTELNAPGPAPQEYGELFVVNMRGNEPPTVTRLFLPATR